MGDNKNNSLWQSLINPPEQKPALDGLSLLRALAPEPKPEVKPRWADILFRPTPPTNQPPQPPTRNPLASLKPFHVTEETKLAVWQKGRIVAGSNPAWVRRDSMGSLMWFADYGDCNSVLGWQIDHIFPRSKGGSDAPHNLQPLNWQNNSRKSDKILPRLPLSP